MTEYVNDGNNNFHSKKKLEFIERLKSLDPNEEQINEMNKILNGEPSQNQILKLLLEFLSRATNNRSHLLYKGAILLAFFIAIGLLALHFPDSDKQVWTLVGTLMGFVFGQNSKILNV